MIASTRVWQYRCVRRLTHRRDLSKIYRACFPLIIRNIAAGLQRFSGEWIR
jgi:hypothetical protein